MSPVEPSTLAMQILQYYNTIRELSPVNLEKKSGGDVWGEEGVGFHQGILID